MKKVLSVFIVLLFSIFITSCASKDDPFRSVVSGDFVYSKVGVSDPEHNVAIIGLSDEGKNERNNRISNNNRRVYSF